MAVAPSEMLPRAVAKLLCAWNRFCSAVSTVVKFVAPFSYCSAASRSAPLAASAQVFRLISRLNEDRNSVGDLLLRYEYEVLVVYQQLLKCGILQTNVVSNLAVVQDVPLEGRAGCICDARRCENLCKIVTVGRTGHTTECPHNADRRIEL